MVTTDRKFGVDVGSNNTINYYEPELLMEVDYYPFGFEMPGRNNISNSYRYGFNGMEQDGEVSGEGNSYDFGARMYNNRVGRFFSVDKKSGIYAHINPYNFAHNRVIFAFDNGFEPITGIIHIHGKEIAFEFDTEEPYRIKFKLPGMFRGNRVISFEPSTGRELHVFKVRSIVVASGREDSERLLKLKEEYSIGGFTVTDLDLIEQFLKENTEVKLVVIGNHEISGKHPHIDGEQGGFRLTDSDDDNVYIHDFKTEDGGIDEEAFIGFQSQFSLKRANNFVDYFLDDIEGTEATSIYDIESDIGESPPHSYKNIPVNTPGKGPTGISAGFDFTNVPSPTPTPTPPSSRGGNKDKPKEKITDVRFLGS